MALRGAVLAAALAVAAAVAAAVAVAGVSSRRNLVDETMTSEESVTRNKASADALSWWNLKFTSFHYSGLFLSVPEPLQNLDIIH
ncbi:Protein of unknown function [Gryllus bimaculatus]|nr:Protein of unknown function [Gryllus bimaculatus]